ncbi:poly-gamma-glutamate synthase PgsB [Streptomyces sp. MAA16]|uniref:poly-gamma-glutamate synthase PgsB n=1 Tax=Streptomyces sp. MAA16 TaxID=3035116 RepID=UPI002473A7B4|nr:poly-gamma-glutamate synthase PgsB [Streptomyces sp. MAA16]MDH6701160.1 poly-gamma-glutamate synthase PgsB/CapB [Streptomyces sp. MAA16]
MFFLYTVLLVCCAILLVAGVVEQRRHFTNLNNIPTRVLVNGIRGKSSITRLCAGALRGGDLVTVAKTTGTAARFIHPDATEEPVYRKFGIANVVEQIGIVRRAAAYNPDALVIECMAVMPALQEINQSKLIRSTIGVLCNVREDHLAEMGPTLDDVARSLSRSMPEGGICVTAEKERFAILQEEADSRDCKLVYADPETVSDEELRGFSWFTFKENVAIALTVAELVGVDRETALQGMYDAPPDPGVLSVERYLTPGDKRLRFANVFAANDPESTLMNINQLLDLGAIHRPLNVVINCRPDRVERNGQMGEIIPELDPEHVFVIGHPAKSAIDAIPAEFRSRAVDLGGDRRDPEEFMARLLDMLGPDSSLVAIGNIHGQGEILLEHLAELPADETIDEPTDEPPVGGASGGASRRGATDRGSSDAGLPAGGAPAGGVSAGGAAAGGVPVGGVPDGRRAAGELVSGERASGERASGPSSSAVPARAAESRQRMPEHAETMRLYAPRIDPYQRYSEAYEARYGGQQGQGQGQGQNPASQQAQEPQESQHSGHSQQPQQHQHHQQPRQHQHQNHQQAQHTQQAQQPHQINQAQQHQESWQPQEQHPHPGPQQHGGPERGTGSRSGSAGWPEAVPPVRRAPSAERGGPPTAPPGPRGLFEPRVPPVNPVSPVTPVAPAPPVSPASSAPPAPAGPSVTPVTPADDPEQWHSPGEPR